MCTQDVSIEFPYMCYGYVDRIELDIAGATATMCKCTGGMEYMFKSFHVPTPDKYTGDITTVNVSMEDEMKGMPLTFARITFDNIIHIVKIRVYGEAISFI